MAVPKRRRSRSRTRSHRAAAWRLTSEPLVSIRVDGKVIRVPRRLVRAYQEGLLKPEG